MLIIGLQTSFISRLNANTEIDLKKIIALSTLSQLGIIVLNLRINIKILSFLHLILHALFKSNLFICAGNLIHLNLNIQDIRLKKGLIKNLPISISSLIISSLALSGTPFITGFYSKDLILEITLINNNS